MKGAIFFSGKYGSTHEYANWIAEATGLQVFDISKSDVNPFKFDYVVLGSSIIYFRLSMKKWLYANKNFLVGKPIVLFSVSGAPAGKKLNNWVRNSIPKSLKAGIEHFSLRGRLDHSKVAWPIRLSLKIGAFFNRDPDASKDERYGFDYVDRNTIDPIVARINEIQTNAVAA